MNEQTPEAPDKAMMIYQSFMTEIKTRLRAVNRYLDAVDNVPPAEAYIAAESAYLQLRMVCELIALGAVIVHEPHLTSRAVLDDYTPSAMFKRLLEANTRCFPEAITISQTREHWHHIDEGPGQPFTVANLNKCYVMCGDALHRGRAKNLLSGKLKNYDIVAVRVYAIAIERLLKQHMILLSGEEAVVIIMDGGADEAVMILRGVCYDEDATAPNAAQAVTAP